MATGTRVGLSPLRQAEDRLVERWRALADRAADPNPFASPDFALPAALTLPDGADAALLHVERDGEMVLAHPVVRRRRYRRLPVTTLMTWRHEYSFLGSPLAAQGDATQDWEAVLAHVRRNSSVDLLALELLPTDGPGLASLQQAAAAHRLGVSTFDQHERPVIVRRNEPDYLYQGMSGKRRKNLRRQRRHLGEHLGGPLQRVDRARQPADVREAVEEFLRLEAAGWKGRAGTAMACIPEHAAFLRVLAESFARAGRLQLWFLEAGGKTVAGQCNLIAGDTVFHFKVAYEETFATYSPGVLLELDMVEEFHHDLGLNRIDSCAAPGSMYESLYPDCRTLTSALLALHGPAKALAPTLAAALRVRTARPASVRRPARDAS